MKKRFFALLLGILMVLVLLPTTALAANWTYDPDEETLTNGSLTLKNVTASGTELTIGVQPGGGVQPGEGAQTGKNEISGALDLSGEITGADGTPTYTITAIGVGAFASQLQLTSVVLPEEVTEVEAYAFAGCNALENITLPGGLKKIGISAFSSCSKLTEIILPENVSEIGDTAFSNCTSLRTVTIDAKTPPKLQNGNRLFQGCSENLYVIVPQESVDEYKEQWKDVEIENIRIAQNYVLTVIGGTGEGEYAEGAEASITATVPEPALEHFVKWEQEGEPVGTFANPYSASTTFTMPASSVTITATFALHTLGTPKFLWDDWKGEDDYLWVEFPCSVCDRIMNTEHATVTQNGETKATCTDPASITYKAEASLFDEGSYTDTHTITRGEALGHNYVNGICTRCEAKKPGTPSSSGSSGSTGSLPVIIYPAENTGVVAPLGGMVTLPVEARGANWYKWQVNRGNGWESILGATASAYVTPMVAAENNGYQYRCVVGNGAGSVISPIFTLQVTNATGIPKTGDQSGATLALALLALLAAGALGRAGYLSMKRQRP